MDNDDRTPKPVSASESPPFDYERSLARLGGDPVLFKEIVELFLEDSPEILQQAGRALREQDVKSLGRAAHSLKNLAATFDAEALTAAAASVERHARDGELGRAVVSYEDMERELEHLRIALERLSKTKKKA